MADKLISKYQDSKIELMKEYMCFGPWDVPLYVRIISGWGMPIY